MALEKYILKIGSGVGHLVSGGLAVDCINNLSQGNYKIAVFEAVTAAYMQIRKAQDRAERRTIDESTNWVREEIVYTPFSLPPCEEAIKLRQLYLEKNF